MPEMRTTFSCPRCRTDVTERFYGPCTSCRRALAGSQGGEARDVTSERFEPRMNVVPNHVATKD